MDHQIVKITELTPQLDMEVLNIAAAAGLEGRMLPGSELFVQFDKHGRVQGAACGNSFGEICMIYLVAVREDSRAMGTGSALVNHLLMYYSQRCKQAYILTDDMMRYFERFGFRKIPFEQLPEQIRNFERLGRLTSARTAALVLDLSSGWSLT
jgi:N-acetylglutamate synthase-like GNAT family acetyltransferase